MAGYAETRKADPPKVITTFHIETKSPGKPWRFLPFTFSTAETIEEARERKQRVEADAKPGWRFRIVRRTATITYTPWEEVS